MHRSGAPARSAPADRPWDRSKGAETTHEAVDGEGHADVEPRGTTDPGVRRRFGFSTRSLGWRRCVDGAHATPTASRGWRRFEDRVKGRRGQCGEQAPPAIPSRPLPGAHDTVWKKLCWRSASRVKVSSGPAPRHGDSSALDGESGLGLAPKPRTAGWHGDRVECRHVEALDRSVRMASASARCTRPRMPGRWKRAVARAAPSARREMRQIVFPPTRAGAPDQRWGASPSLRTTWPGWRGRLSVLRYGRS